MEISSRLEKTKARRCESEDAIQIPKILEMKVEPLFSLPSDLISPKRCKRTGEALIKGKIQKLRDVPHSMKRLREEKFRRYKKQTRNLYVQITPNIYSVQSKLK